MSLNVGAFLAASGVATTVRRYARDETIFTPGDACDEILYIQAGGVKLSALSRIGRRVDLPMLGPGEFFGEGSLGGQRIRVGCATAITPSTIICVTKKAMLRLLRLEPAMSGRFISHMLSRNIRLEEELVEQLLPWRREVTAALPHV